MGKVSISIVYLQQKYGDREALRIAREAGADGVDFSLDGVHDYTCETSVYSRSEEEIREYFTSLKEYADSLGLAICQTHGRLRGFLGDAERDAELLRNTRLDCLATSLLGAPVCVVHAVTTIYHPDATPEQMRELNYDMYRRMLPFAREYGVRIATETFGGLPRGGLLDFFGSFDEFVASYERICADPEDRRAFTICMDTGHTHNASKFEGNPEVPDAIRALGGEISVLHLHDNNTDRDQHLLPIFNRRAHRIGKTIDWDATFEAFREIGYDGYWNLEVYLPRFGEEPMPEFARFAVAALRAALAERGL